jgi:hypothetical protein
MANQEPSSDCPSAEDIERYVAEYGTHTQQWIDAMKKHLNSCWSCQNIYRGVMEATFPYGWF